MSAIVIPFPCGRRDRARPATERRDYNAADAYGTHESRETVLGKVRAIGFKVGLNNFNRAALVNLAGMWFDTGVQPSHPQHGIYARATASAIRMVERQPTGPGAA